MKGAVETFASVALKSNGRVPVIGRSLPFGTQYPPSPLLLQNLENKQVILRLRARSLSLKDLHAKSREHGSYGCEVFPFWETTAIVPRALAREDGLAGPGGAGNLRHGQIVKELIIIL